MRPISSVTRFTRFTVDAPVQYRSRSGPAGQTAGTLAVGAGVAARTSSTTDEGGRWLSSASGVRISRCTSTGMATSLTSSGVVNARPSVAAKARAARTRAMLPRGLAPYRTAVCSRVAATSLTAYELTAGSTWTDRTAAIAFRDQLVRRE